MNFGFKELLFRLPGHLLRPRSGRQHKAWGVSPGNEMQNHERAREAGDSAAACFAGSDSLIIVATWGLRPRLYAVARFAGVERADPSYHIELSRSAERPCGILRRF